MLIMHLCLYRLEFTMNYTFCQSNVAVHFSGMSNKTGDTAEIIT